MLTFNSILRSDSLDPAKIKLVRHQDTRHPGRPTPYDLWRANNGRFDFYQRIQGGSSVFAAGDVLASFVVTPLKETLFVGIYLVTGVGRVPKGVRDPIGAHDVGGLTLYEIERDTRLNAYAGRLVIDWGAGFRRWVQRAHRQDKLILEIRKDVSDPPFPGFALFCWDIDELASVPPRWQEVLKSVKGVYLLVCKKTGRQYVGSAKGDQSLWGRFLDYANNGHGGNVELKQRGNASYRVTVLEVVNSDYGIERVEEAWKRKLLSREFGLNKN